MRIQLLWFILLIGGASLLACSSDAGGSEGSEVVRALQIRVVGDEAFDRLFIERVIAVGDSVSMVVTVHNPADVPQTIRGGGIGLSRVGRDDEIGGGLTLPGTRSIAPRESLDQLWGRRISAAMLGQWALIVTANDLSYEVVRFEVTSGVP